MSAPSRINLALLTGRAMGHQNGDTITLANQWASVTITLADGRYTVTGDLCHKNGRDFVYSPRLEFALLVDALLYALESLAHYERGALR